MNQRLAEGRMQEKKAMAIKLKNKGFNIDMIVSITDLSKKEMESL